MTAKWYEMPALLDRGTVVEAIAANGGNQSAAAADLGCTAAQLKKATEVYCIVSMKELEEGKAAELSLRRMLLSGMLVGDGEGGTCCGRIGCRGYLMVRKTEYPALSSEASVRALLGEHKSVRRVAEVLGCSRKTVWCAMRRFGVRQEKLIVTEEMRKRLRL